jgi:hypothetical protein
MKVAFLALVLLLGVAALPAHAATDPLSYDDPAVHFRPPDGWERLSMLPSATPSPGDPGPPAAVYIKNRGKQDARTIVLTIQNYDGGLDNLETSHENDLRTAADGVFIDKKIKTTLANGMPAWFLRVSSGSQLGDFLRRYEYLVYDGKRSIVASYIGRQGDFDEKEAKDALASLYVVLYPRDRS